MVRQGTDREGRRRWTPGPGPRHRPGLVGWMPSPPRFVDGVVVDGIWMRKGWMMGTADVDRFSYRFRRPFEDGGHVDACVELSGSRWLHVNHVSLARLWPASVASLPGFWRTWIRRSAVFDGRHPFLSGMRRRGLRLMDGPARLFRCGFPITRRRVWCHGRRCRPCGWCVSPRV